MPRGGYQKPKNPAPVSGPGRFSRRTDGAITEPDIDKERGLQYGDRKMLVDAQHIAKTAVGAGAKVQPVRAAAGSAPTRGRLPAFLATSPDTAPDEPTTAGLDMGPGPGSEALAAGTPTDSIAEQTLRFLWETYGDSNARAMLADMRAQRAAPTSTTGPAPAPAMADEESFSDPLAGWAQ